MRATGNPGNVGSQWVKEMFVDPAEPNTAFNVGIDTPNGKKYITRRFIPAKLQDNPYLMQTDDYYIMLASLPEAQRKQFLDGDWDAYEDSAFPEFSKTTMLSNLLRYLMDGISFVLLTGVILLLLVFYGSLLITIIIYGFIENYILRKLQQIISHRQVVRFRKW